MFIDKFKPIQKPRQGTILDTGIFRKEKISFHKFEILAPFIEIVFTVTTVIFVGIVFQRYHFESQFMASSWLCIGITAGLLQAAGTGLLGLYRFPVLIAPGPHIEKLLTIWALITLLFTLGLIFPEISRSVSPGPLAAALLTQCFFLLAGRYAFANGARNLLLAEYPSGSRTAFSEEPSQFRRLIQDFLHSHSARQEIDQPAAAPLRSRGSPNVAPGNGHPSSIANVRGAEGFLLTARWNSLELFESVHRRFRMLLIPSRMSPDLAAARDQGQSSLLGGRIDPLSLQKNPLTNSETSVKRTLDILFSLIALFLLWPVFLLAAAAIRLDDGGPVIFRQRRTGQNLREFIIFKFRTMKVLEDGPEIVQAIKGDHRVTAAGRLLRRSSIDELPQLFNVLMGDMSLVGPRPHAIAHDSQYKTHIADYARRFQFKPGVTGWAQVNGLRGETASLEEMAKRVRFDLWYIDNWSLLLDLKILARSCFVPFRDCAY